MHLRGFDHWMGSSVATPLLLALARRHLSHRLGLCRLVENECHVAVFYMQARSHLILHTLVLHDCCDTSHVSLTELACVPGKAQGNVDDAGYPACVVEYPRKIEKSLWSVALRTDVDVLAGRQRGQ